MTTGWPGAGSRTLAGLLAAALVTSACDTKAPTPISAPATEQPQRGGRVVEGALNEPTTLQPTLASLDSPSTLASLKVYDTLARVDTKTGELKPNLATWTVSADGRTYTFEIDKRANWSDGVPITALDWVTGVKAFARSKKVAGGKPGGRSIEGFAEFEQGKASSVSGIALDGKRFTVRVKDTLCSTLLRLSGSTLGPSVVPAHVFGRYLSDDDPSRNLDDAPENIAPPVSSGPFLLKEWRKGDELVFARNATYWRGAPLLDEYVIRKVANQDELIRQLKAGTVTIGAITDARKIAELKGTDLVVHRFPENGYTYIGWNARSGSAPALADVRVRRALAYGLDMDLVIQNLLGGEGVRMNSHFVPASWAHTSGLNEYGYDPAKAEQLLRSAGYARNSQGIYARDGVELAFSIVTNRGNPLREGLLQLAVDQYREIGVKVTPRLQDLKSLVADLERGSTEIEGWILNVGFGAEPDAFPEWHSSNIPPNPTRGQGAQNWTGFTAPGLDEAIERARAGPDCRVQARKPAFDAVNRILNEGQPYNFGFSQNRLFAAAAGLREFAPGTFGNPNFEQWWVKK